MPLSFTLEGVSIPFIQLLMRGDILIIAPIVDLMFGRKVRWWSWAALVMVCVALFVVVNARGNLNLPPIGIATVVLYTLGYFLRLAVMTKISKSGDEASVRRGRTSINFLWGNQLTVLVGDLLYAGSINLALSEGSVEILKLVTIHE